MGFLQVKGKYIVDSETGEKVFLRGVCLGGWLNMENFITGYPGVESAIRRTIMEELGEERYNAFFTSLLDSFITEDDFKFLSEIGATVVRIPFNYRHFEDDANPGQYNPIGFYYLDRAVEWAKKYSIYVILDLHSAQGWQNPDWHSDNPYGVSLLWEDRSYQERVKNLWLYIAEHYKNEPWVAGYNLINEPTAPNMKILNRLYKEWVRAIREKDKLHIIFIEGNMYSTIFEGLDEPFDNNLVYSSHNYTIATRMARKYPGYVGDLYIDKKWMEETFLKTNKWILEREIPSWIGEFGARYYGAINSPTSADRARISALKDQLEIFNRYEQHWTIWTYKDLGMMGVVVANPDSEYIRRIRPILELEKKFGIGLASARRGLIISKINEMVDLIAQTVAVDMEEYSLDYKTMYKKLETTISGITGNILGPLYALQFADMTEEEIKRMHYEAFEFKNCIKKILLVELLENVLKG
jgi:endoglucanase